MKNKSNGYSLAGEVCLALTLNWASGGPVTITILTLESGVSAGAIC